MSHPLPQVFVPTICLLAFVALGACDDAGDASGGAGHSGTDSDASTDQGGDGTGSGGTGDLNGPDSGSGGGGPVACSNTNTALAVSRLDSLAVASLGTPFDTDADDLAGPNSWGARYGKTPEIVPVVHDDGLAVLFQDQDDDEQAYVVHVVEDGGNYEIDAAYQVESLGRIMGLSRDDAGNYYVATGVAEGATIDESTPPNDIHRPDVVRIVKFDENGCVQMESDVDMERGKKDSGSEIIVNPMVAASSRLVWGADRLLLVHGHNTEADFNLPPNQAGDHPRHQKAIATHIDAATGAATRTSTMWVSHSFDQRALFDGTGFVEFHLGDAYPRALALGRYGDSEAQGDYKPFQIKGNIGANETHTRLGGIVQTGDATYGYLALFATENGDTTTNTVNAPRNLALARIRSDFTTLSSSASVVDQGDGTTTLAVTQHWTENNTPQQATRTNHLRWLTDLGSNTHAERPRLVAIGAGRFVVLFERWTTNGTNQSNDAYTGTYGLVIDTSGAVTTPLAELPGKHHIGRGDDAVAWGGKAVYVTGADGSLWLHFVDDSLATTHVELP